MNFIIYEAVYFTQIFNYFLCALFVIKLQMFQLQNVHIRLCGTNVNFIWKVFYLNETLKTESREVTSVSPSTHVPFNNVAFDAHEVAI